MQEEPKDYNIDPLTGMNASAFDNELDNAELDKEKPVTFSNKQVNKKAADVFLDNSRSYNPENHLSKLSPEHFALVANLDPREASDEDFFQASKQFNNEDFARATLLAYYRREANRSDIDYVTKEIEIKKGDRRLILSQMRNSSNYLWENYSKEEWGVSRLIRKMLEKFWFPIIGFFRRMFGVQRLEIVITLGMSPEQSELLWGFWIESPSVGESHSIKTENLYIYGWIMPKDMQGSTIELTCKQKEISRIYTTISRPDVTHAYCLTSNFHNWGYILPINSKELPKQGILQLKATFSSGIQIQLGLIKFNNF